MAEGQRGKGSRGERRRAVAWATAAVMIAAAFAGAMVVNAAAGLKPGPNEYNIGAWEVRNVPNKWLFLAGELLRGSPSEAEQNDTLRRFFELNRRIDELSNESSDTLSRGMLVDQAITDELNALLRERDAIENQAEATLESRLTKVIEQENLTRDLLFAVVWPPVDAEFTEAPRALARSPRDRIELLGSSLLKDGLTLTQVEEIEAEAQEENVSALSFGTAGIGAYPTIIDHPGNYRRALEVIAHEWMHNYLFFHPLGFNYYGSNDLRTMNETVADLVGRELADSVIARWPLDAAPSVPTPPTAAVPAQPPLDLRAELRKLRGEVDTLLAEGKIHEAETHMEMRRQELAEAGYFIRKINQAYFAYLNLYAGESGSAAATNPIGPKIDELRRRYPSLRDFVAVISAITTVEELDSALQSSP